MEYKVLYRKYRPTNFDQIVGQDYIINILKKAVVNNKLSHAYLFSGPRGTGKTSTAKVFAKAINCEDNNLGNPCDKCPSCVEFDGSPDIIEIDAASNNGVDEIRELRNNVKLVPALSKYKVYIIDEVHMLSIGAFNALLKTLEEPPAHVIFILATTDAQKIPVTVISRCQRFDFHQLSSDVISNYLLDICQAEGIKASKEATDEIAYLSDGAMRDALGLLDQILSVVNKELKTVDVEKIIKTVSKQKLEELYLAIESNDAEKTSKIVNDLANSGYDFTSFVNKLVKFLRDKAILVKQNKNNSQMPFTKIKNLIFNLNKILYNSKTEISPYLLAEIELLDNIDTKDTLIENNSFKEIPSSNLMVENPIDSREPVKLKKAEKGLDKDFKRIRINNCFAKASKERLNASKKNWLEFINYLSEENHKLYGFAVDSDLVAASDNYLLLKCNSESQTSLFNKNVEKIEKEYLNFLKEEYLMALLTEEEWKNYKNKYIDDKKKNITYEIIEETKPKTKNVAENKLSKIAYKIFDEKNIKVE